MAEGGAPLGEPTRGGAEEASVRALVHDLRSPLAIAEGFAALLATSELDEDQRGHVERIRSAVEEMAERLDRAQR